MFVRQRAVRAASLPPEKLARITPAKMPMMAMTTSSSMRVKAGERGEEKEEGRRKKEEGRGEGEEEEGKEEGRGKKEEVWWVTSCCGWTTV